MEGLVRLESELLMLTLLSIVGVSTANCDMS